jgi:hypothetical protein
MNEQVEELAVGPAPQPKRNRGWFQPADRRINREGRPHGKIVAVPEGLGSNCARRTDRVMLLVLKRRILRCCLTQPKAPWVTNLPPGFRVVDCRVDETRGAVVFTIQSERFPRIAKGALIPELKPDFNGLMWCRAAAGD